MILSILNISRYLFLKGKIPFEEDEVNEIQSWESEVLLVSDTLFLFKINTSATLSCSGPIPAEKS